MGFDLVKDWPVYLLLGAVIWFFIYVAINSRKQERIDKEEKNKEKMTQAQK